MRTIVKQTDNEKMVHHTGITRFSGCQCFKDCTCNEDFKPAPFDYYTVVRRIGTKKQKTTVHQTIEEANERWDFICLLANEHNGVG
jgi:hypothetical protein